MIKLLVSLGADPSLQGGVSHRFHPSRLRNCMVVIFTASKSTPASSRKTGIQLGLRCFYRFSFFLQACLRRHGAFPIVQYLIMLSGDDARITEDKVSQSSFSDLTCQH